MIKPESTSDVLHRPECLRPRIAIVKLNEVFIQFNGPLATHFLGFRRFSPSTEGDASSSAVDSESKRPASKPS